MSKILLADIILGILIGVCIFLFRENTIMLFIFILSGIIFKIISSITIHKETGKIYEKTALISNGQLNLSVKKERLILQIKLLKK